MDDTAKKEQKPSDASSVQDDSEFLLNDPLNPSENLEPKDKSKGKGNGNGNGSSDGNGGSDEQHLLRENEKLLRALAEAENMRKRCVKEKEEALKYAVAEFARALLPSIDNLQRALDAGTAETGNSALLTGIQMTYDSLIETLRAFHVVRVEALGKTFDPHRHQAVNERPAQEGQKKGDVVAVLQHGFHFHDRLLRPALVEVAQ